MPATPAAYSVMGCVCEYLVPLPSIVMDPLPGCPQTDNPDLRTALEDPHPPGRGEPCERFDVARALKRPERHRSELSRVAGYKAG
jgi:hypothetical protein